MNDNLTIADIITARKVTMAALQVASTVAEERAWNATIARMMMLPSADNGLRLTPIAASMRASGCGAHISAAAAVKYVLATPQPSPRNSKSRMSMEAQQAIYNAAAEKRARKQQAAVIAAGGTTEGDF